MNVVVRFWRTLPRAFVGLLVVVELYVLLVGTDAAAVAAKGIRALRDLLGDGTAGVTLVVTALTAAAVGAELVRIVLVPLRWIAARIMRVVGAALPSPTKDMLSTLSTPAPKLAVQLFTGHPQYISSFYEGYSRGTLGTLEGYKTAKENWSDHFALLGEVFGALRDGPLEMWRIAYYAQVTQEQALADYEETLMESVQMLWIALIVAPVVAVRSHATGEIVARVTVAALTLIVLLVPTFRRRKLALAWYIVHVHALTFIFGEAADVTDREAE